MIIETLREAGFTLELSGDGFDIYGAPLTDEQVKYLAAHKPEIVQELKNELLILGWLSIIGADKNEIADMMDRCKSDSNVMEYFLSRAAKNSPRGNVRVFPVKTGFVRCHTPTGNSIDVEARNLEHAEFLRKMNPEHKHE